MNGIHDMGGMDGFGPVIREENEPVFHEDWEKRMFAIALSMIGRFNTDEFRHALERIPAPVYVNSSYYERWLMAIETLLTERGIVTADELRSHQIGASKPSQPPRVHEGAARDTVRSKARFAAGDGVVARTINPSGHTRIPRYIRGRRGVIHRDWGVYTFADSNAHHAGKNRQHVYSVAFAARELWGKDAARRDTVHIDLWEDYLEGAQPAPKRSKRAARKVGKGNKR